MKPSCPKSWGEIHFFFGSKLLVSFTCAVRDAPELQVSNMTALADQFEVFQVSGVYICLYSPSSILFLMSAVFAYPRDETNHLIVIKSKEWKWRRWWQKKEKEKESGNELKGKLPSGIEYWKFRLCYFGQKWYSRDGFRVRGRGALHSLIAFFLVYQIEIGSVTSVRLCKCQLHGTHTKR